MRIIKTEHVCGIANNPAKYNIGIGLIQFPWVSYCIKPMYKNLAYAGKTSRDHYQIRYLWFALAIRVGESDER